jgi:hypothetical protein
MDDQIGPNRNRLQLAMDQDLFTIPRALFKIFSSLESLNSEGRLRGIELDVRKPHRHVLRDGHVHVEPSETTIVTLTYIVKPKE